MMPPPPQPASSSMVRPKKSFFKSKSQTTDKRKGLAAYKHSFGASVEKEDKDEEFRQKVFQKALRYVLVQGVSPQTVISNL